MPTFDHAGASLWYESTGEGDLVIALHGGLGLDHTYFRPWLDPLSDLVNLTYLDFRANGRSTGDGAHLTMGQLADDVDALRKHAGHERVWLLGHSYGGFVALEYALRFSDHLAGLVLLDTDSAGPTPETMMAGLQRLGVAPEELDAFETPVVTTEDMLELMDVVGPWYLPHSEAGVAREVMSGVIYRQDGSNGGSGALAGWDVTTRLPEIDAPALVLTGADDFMFPPDGARRLAEALPRGRADVLERCGHLPFVERPDETLQILRDFVARTPAPQDRTS